MVTQVNGFELAVTVEGGVPHVRVNLKGGPVIVDINAVSVTGLQKLPEVFEMAASIALRELEHYYAAREASEQAGGTGTEPTTRA